MKALIVIFGLLAAGSLAQATEVRCGSEILNIARPQQSILISSASDADATATFVGEDDDGNLIYTYPQSYDQGTFGVQLVVPPDLFDIAGGERLQVIQDGERLSCSLVRDRDENSGDNRDQ